MPLLPSECPNCGRLHSGHDFGADPGPLQRQIAQLTEALAEARVYVDWFADNEEFDPQDTLTAKDVSARIAAVLAGKDAE